MAEYGQQAIVGLLEVILQELQEAHETGLLTVQRSKAGVRDVGTITLLHGEPVEAHAGERLGNDAIQWLYTWGRCQCEFLPQAPSELVLSPLPPPTVEVETSSSPLAFLSRLRPGKNQSANEPVEVNRLNRSAQNEEPPVVQVPFNPPVAPGPPRAPNPPVAPNLPRALPETPAPFQPLYPQPSVRAAQSGSDLIFSDWLRNGSQPAQQAPQRLWQGQDALLFLERAHASRLHRHVFLLLDGQRTIPDLVRITGHAPEEIKHLLNDLERLGLIKQEHEVQARW